MGNSQGTDGGGAAVGVALGGSLWPPLLLLKALLASGD